MYNSQFTRVAALPPPALVLRGLPASAGWEPNEKVTGWHDQQSCRGVALSLLLLLLLLLSLLMLLLLLLVMVLLTVTVTMAIAYILSGCF